MQSSLNWQFVPSGTRDVQPRNAAITAARQRPVHRPMHNGYRPARAVVQRTGRREKETGDRRQEGALNTSSEPGSIHDCDAGTGDAWCPREALS